MRFPVLAEKPVPERREQLDAGIAVAVGEVGVLESDDERGEPVEVDGPDDLVVEALGVALDEVEGL